MRKKGARNCGIYSAIISSIKVIDKRTALNVNLGILGGQFAKFSFIKDVKKR